MLFQQSIMGNSRIAASHHEEVRRNREADYLFNQNLNLMGGLNVNEGLIPRDVFQDFDNVTVERMRSDDGDAFLDPLMNMSKSINIGKLVQFYRQSSDMDGGLTSMSGQTGVRLDQVQYMYDGSIVPIHENGFRRNFREMAAMGSEGFDALIDDQRESVAAHKRHLVANFRNGHRDHSGNLINVNGVTWEGYTADQRVAQVDLGIGGINMDFTDDQATGEQLKAAWIEMRDILRIDNNCPMDVTYYVSREIASNFERRFSQQYDAKIIDQELAGLRGVANIVESNALTGNEILAFPHDQNWICPVVGMSINTTAKARKHFNDDYEFSTWSAVGFQVRNDFLGRTCAMYATG